MSKFATKKQMRAWGAVIPGYPLGRGEALIKDGTRDLVLGHAKSAGFTGSLLIGVGHDYNFGGDLYKFVRVEKHT